MVPFSIVKDEIACVAGGMRERASGGAAIFASGEAASEIPACHIWYGFCRLPTFSTFDESIKEANQRTKYIA